MRGSRAGPHAIFVHVSGERRRATYEDLCKVPDHLVAEIIDGELISPSTGALDRGRKMQVYARERLGHLWIVDPSPRTLEIYSLEDGRWVVLGTHAGSAHVRAEPFEAVELVTTRWWREP